MKKHIFIRKSILHNRSYEQLKYFYKNLFYICLLLTLFCLFLVKVLAKAENENLQEGIASQLIRFHVIANSDSEKDQALKLEIKQALTEALRLKLEKASNIDEARTVLKNSLSEMVSISDSIIEKNGFSYKTTATLKKEHFPLKVYGDLTLPPGEYEAVCVRLGKARGRNWWCVMYPPLCFVDATYSVVPDSSRKELKYILTEEEYKAIFSSKRKPKIKVKFKLLPFLNKD